MFYFLGMLPSGISKDRVLSMWTQVKNNGIKYTEEQINKCLDQLG